MIFKDYYKILGINPTASMNDIKSSYRKLALKYHPDRTSGDKRAEERFREVKEAYEILSKPIRRESFDYDYKKHYQTGGTTGVNGKQQSNRGQQTGPAATAKKTATFKQGESLTATAFLTRAQNINKLYKVNAKGKIIDQEQLYSLVNDLLKKSNLTQLLIWGDAKTNTAIVKEVLATCDLLSYQYIDSIGVRLAELAGTDNATINKVFTYCEARKRKINLQRVVVIAAIIAIAFLFFLLLGK
jgi:hypothetical protein